MVDLEHVKYVSLFFKFKRLNSSTLHTRLVERLKQYTYALTDEFLTLNPYPKK